MIKAKNIKILKTDTSLWSNKKNGHTRIKGIIDRSGNITEYGQTRSVLVVRI